jgi:hypothetical protein
MTALRPLGGSDESLVRIEKIGRRVILSVFLQDLMVRPHEFV